MRIAVVLDAFAVVLALSGFLLGCEQGGGTSAETAGDAGAMVAHAFSLDASEAGKTRSVDLARFRGKPIILNFWATWCPPCLDELPSFLKFAARAHREAGVETFAVSIDESWAVVDAFFKQKKLWSQGALPITILLDPKGSVALSYGTTRYPETYFIDRNFKIIRKFVGPQDWGSQEIMQWVAEHSK